MAPPPLGPTPARTHSSSETPPSSITTATTRQRYPRQWRGRRGRRGRRSRRQARRRRRQHMPIRLILSLAKLSPPSQSRKSERHNDIHFSLRSPTPPPRPPPPRLNSSSNNISTSRDSLLLQRRNLGSHRSSTKKIIAPTTQYLTKKCVRPAPLQLTRILLEQNLKNCRKHQVLLISQKSNHVSRKIIAKNLSLQCSKLNFCPLIA